MSSTRPGKAKGTPGRTGLTLSKETLKDLGTRGGADRVKGGTNKTGGCPTSAP